MSQVTCAVFNETVPLEMLTAAKWPLKVTHGHRYNTFRYIIENSRVESRTENNDF